MDKEQSAFVAVELTRYSAPKEPALYRALLQKGRAVLIPLRVDKRVSLLVVPSNDNKSGIRAHAIWLHAFAIRDEDLVAIYEQFGRMLYDMNVEVLRQWNGGRDGHLQLFARSNDLAGWDPMLTVLVEWDRPDDEPFPPIVDKLRSETWITLDTLLETIRSVYDQVEVKNDGDPPASDSDEPERVESEQGSVPSGGGGALWGSWSRWALFRQMVRRAPPLVWIVPPSGLVLEAPFTPRIRVRYEWLSQTACTLTTQDGVQTRVDFTTIWPAGTPSYHGDYYALRLVELLSEGVARAVEQLQPLTAEWARAAHDDSFAGLRAPLIWALRAGPEWRKAGMSDEEIVRGAQQRLERTLRQNPHLQGDDAGLARKLKAQLAHEHVLRQLQQARDGA